MRQETINIYTIEDHPNKDDCFEWIRKNWYDLGDHCIADMVLSLKALAEAINGKLDYSISIVPDQGEYVKITDYNATALRGLYEKRDECPLTGYRYDFDVIDGLVNGVLGRQVLNTLHEEGEYLYSDEGLLEMCQMNEYEFHDDGSVY